MTFNYRHGFLKKLYQQLPRAQSFTYSKPAARRGVCRVIMASSTNIPRVLSIQSHVVHGYVGGKCAVFTLQRLGFEVDPVYSVQFSNHTGYPTFKGSVFDGKHLQDLLDGLEVNELTNYSHLLTGYIGSVSLLNKIAEVCRKLKEWNSELTYVCDPVLGDEGRLYVPLEMVESYRNTIVPLASILVPNQFEAELITELKINSPADGFKACTKLQEMDPHTVVITSMTLASEPGTVTLLASTSISQDRGPSYQQVSLTIPRINAYFTGTGDLLAALLLGRLHKRPNDLSTAIEEAVASLQSILLDTAEACGEEVLMAPRSADVCNKRELRLIQGQEHLVDPKIILRCVPNIAS
ncbi:hypothetical protein CEUSTIGMA_g2827.t1 [Chlamydomonas eustigma]|uniref:pyridoxal kinase n=1 Tax=Chlamydomonas eustigma TaxID=1157962 RepID=A0A250WX18_9CHLO|nr:hypothetical protein CEUSTIGMA_g2827.t1 [Chlamydomonas eustigma]|eukprot:GAX75383.1 hypothetical protein CEUSTIGMA_g2827.t1 [Chlamydomonas eustigma]